MRPNKIPDEIIMANTLGDLVWLNDDEIELISKLNLPQEPPIRIRLNDKDDFVKFSDSCLMCFCGRP